MGLAATLRIPQKKESLVLTASVFIAGLCSIIYELLIGTISSYFLGDSVKQFSLTIGFYMAAMGAGSYLSRYFTKNLLAKFIGLEIGLGFLGGISIPALYLTFTYTDSFLLVKTFFIVSIGILIGLEVPLLSRLMEKHYSLKLNISNILSLDYFGALIATLLFPFVLLPFIGTFKSSLVFGLINMSIGFINLWAFSDQLKISKARVLLFLSIIVTLFLSLILVSSESILKHWHDHAYEDRVVFSKQSNYQSVVITKHEEDIRLFLNGSLQFSSIDEYRYHESLVHVPMSTSRKLKKILILGGGDGLAIRELLKYSSVESITLVDLDPLITEIAKKNYYLKKLNKKSLFNEKVKIINHDAFVYLKDSRDKYDLIISDLPDPNNVSLARLYSIEFYKIMKQSLTMDGLFVTQATSPFYAKKTFWCIKRTIEKSGLTYTYPYHVNIPSFAEWGFVMASRRPIEKDDFNVSIETRFLDKLVIEKSFIFEKDLQDNLETYSSLEKPLVLSYYLDEWKYWN